MQQNSGGADPGTATSRGGLSITDERTGRRYELPVTDGTIRALELRQIKAEPGEFGLMAYDPGYTNTASCRSAITFIDGGEGVLNYRGYPIEQLAEGSGFLEVAWLLFEGELPTPAELEGFVRAVGEECRPPEWLKAFCDAQPRDAHPMLMLMSGLAALGGAFPDGAQVRDAENRRRQIHRILALTPVLAAYGYRRREGLPYVEPDTRLSYTGNFLRMLRAEPGQDFVPDEVLERALRILLILHEDHEQNCSTTAVRNVGSSQADPYSAVAAGVAALYGPLHGGANQAVLEMLKEIGHRDRVAEYVQSCKDGQRRLMGFGHRVYKSYDPRAKIIKDLAHEVFSVTGVNPKLEIAQELERIALSDPYFVDRKLYPNVDFYSGLIYDAMGFDPRTFPVFFAVGRVAGWLAHWDELMRDPDFKIVRPRQIYTGPGRRDYVPIDRR